ncbi:MAG: hypothetical protein K0S41_2069 [Anaerocolumna sp.]|jgi:DNA-directed RNA polymerase subunit RPC12/RpoP|nr:hypothetical protein [Anaerocolumna sp.]
MGTNNRSFIPFGEFNKQEYGSDFLDKYWDYEINKINPNDIGKGSRQLIWIKCQEHDYHGSYELKAYSFNQGCRCPYCSGKRVHKNDSLGYMYPQVIEMWSYKNELSPYEITYGSGRDIWLKCQEGIHDDYKTKPYRAKEHEFRCPNCSQEQDKSRIQTKVENFIKEEFGFTLLHEYDCNIIAQNPKKIKNSMMPYDIEIAELKLICEVQGQQHFEITGWSRSHAKRNNTTPEFELKKRKLYDRYKKYIAFKKGYSYLAVPYWFETNDNYKDLLRNKIWNIILTT